MKANHRMLIGIAMLCTVAVPLTARAQAPSPHVPLQKAIGEPAHGVVPSLVVMNARGATLKDGKLILSGISPNSIVFADRPVRAAGHVPTARVLDEWSTSGTSADSFRKVPPNATVSAFSKNDGTVRDAVVVLKSVKVDNDQVAFDVDVLEGSLAGADGPVSVFIDRFGFGGFGGHFGGGFAGHAAWYRGGFGPGWHHGWGRGWGPAWGAGAALAGVAVGAAAASAPAYYPPAYYAPPACGYYPYPPC
jgi:hypothetical protein